MIKIICVGKIKENYVKEGIKDYKDRISKYIKIKIIETKEYNFDLSKTLLKEKEEIQKHLKKDSYIILLDINSDQYSSKEFAKKIEQKISSHKEIIFIIGGSFGVHNTLKEKCDIVISFSKFTFPHQVFRFILLEQIYRALKIIKNESYHK